MRDIENALAELRNAVVVPPVDPAREALLLKRFDAHRARAPRAFMFSFRSIAAAAALIAITVSLNWLVIGRGPAQSDAVVATAPNAGGDLTGFVAWPGASAWPPFESGSLMRVNLPVSMLPALGLSAPTSASGLVPADIVVGQDGLARAVRLVQQQ
jgi:hypothetical protein